VWDSGRTSPLNRAVYPDAAARRAPAAGIGCPSFTKDSVWKRPDDDAATPMTVCPGQHAIADEDGAYPIVWWDPHSLDLDVEAAIGIRRETLIMKDVPEAVVAEGLRDYENWKTAHEQAIARGSAPSLSVTTATEWAASGAAAAPDVAQDLSPARRPPVQPGLFDAERPAARNAAASSSDDRHVLVVDARGPTGPGGPRFGELVHAMLAAIPLDADRDAIAALAGVQGRILAAPAEEIAAARETVERVLAHDLLARARAAEARGACRRETPVTCMTRSGTLIEGVVDLAFEEPAGWTILDYKTDRELAASGAERYRRQVALYAAAIAEATGRVASGVLVRI
jgi:ATP-dependent exoDNAse (exonuclease V) beta subunit